MNVTAENRTKQIKVVGVQVSSIKPVEEVLDGFIADVSESDTIVNSEELEQTTLFEGLSNETKVELKAKYGHNIQVYYQQQYTTIGAGQTYVEALADDRNINKLCYTEVEFLAYAQEMGADPILWAYSQKDLDKKLGTNKTSKQKQSKTYYSSHSSLTKTPNLAAYLFTSMSDIEGDEFPFIGITKEQVTAAKSSLEEEDYALAEYANANNLSINDEQVRAQQIEACIFLAGSVKGLESYISNSAVKWIGGGESNRKGLIKNTVNSATKQQIILLIIDTRLRANRTILTQLGYFS